MSELNDLTLKVSDRLAGGRQVCKKLRASGSIPVVFYGKELNKMYSVQEREFRSLMRNSAGAAALFRLESEGGEDELALIKELQRHPLTDDILHIDFLQVTRGQELQTKVPVTIVGEAVGVKNSGGILEVSSTEVDIRCRPSLLPSSIELDVCDLDLGQNLQLSDLPTLEGITYPGDPSQVIVSCVGSASGRAAADEDDDLVDAESEEGEGGEEAGEKTAEDGEGGGEESQDSDNG